MAIRWPYPGDEHDVEEQVQDDEPNSMRRAAVRADHSACAAAKNCSGCKTPYVAAVEAPLALEVAAFCTQALQARMCS